MVFPEYGKAESGDTMREKLMRHGFAFEEVESPFAASTSGWSARSWAGNQNNAQ